MWFTQSCLIFCNPMDCSTPGFPVLFYLREFALTRIHWGSDIFQASHPLSRLLLLPLIFPSIKFFSNESALLIKVSELQLQYQSFQWIFRIDFLYNWLIWSLCSSRDSQETSPTPQFKSLILRSSVFFMVQLSHLYMTTGKTVALIIWTFLSKDKIMKYQV